MRTTMILLLLSLALPAQAELFRNAYVSFELPPNWACKLEKTEWVCTSKYAKNVKEAIIVLTILVTLFDLILPEKIPPQCDNPPCFSQSERMQDCS